MHLCSSYAYPFIATSASRSTFAATPGTYLTSSAAGVASSLITFAPAATAPSYSSMLFGPDS